MFFLWCNCNFVTKLWGVCWVSLDLCTLFYLNEITCVLREKNVHICKAWVAKCFIQIQGVDYDKNIFACHYAQVCIQILLAIFVYFDFEIWHMDVKWLF